MTSGEPAQHRHVRGRYHAVRAAVAVAMVAGATVGGLAAASHAATTTRVAGADRYATAAALSASAFAPGVAVVYVATGADFADGLAGGPAAAKARGPILLVSRDTVPTATSTELSRLHPGRIVVLGGLSAVADAAFAQLRQYTTGDVTRLAGADRYATAAAVSAATFPAGVPVYLATGQAFPDALAGGAAAGARGGPVLLTSRDSLPAPTAQELRRLQPSSITILGGPAAVSAPVAAALASFTAGQVGRLAGTDRYATAVAVSAATFTHASTVYLATGATFPDALGGAPAASIAAGPLLLSSQDCVPASVDAELTRLQANRVVLLGGPSALGAAVASRTVCAAAGTGPGSIQPPVAGVPQSPDYATEVLSDPWDYSNTADIHTGTPQMSDGGTIAAGELHYVTATQYPWMDPIPYLPGSTPLERDGPSHPVDASRYTHLAVRMNVSAGGSALIFWATCDPTKHAGCTGAMGVPVTAGWHTYDWTLAPNDATNTAPWAGQVLQLRFIPTSQQGASVDVDWMRLHGNGPDLTFAYQSALPGQPTDVFWDTDADPGNNTPDNPGWGLLSHVDVGPTAGTVSFPAAQYPPGTYRVFTRSGESVGPYTAPQAIGATPLPVIDTPSARGGQDYASTVRHDAWDYSTLSDVGTHGNATNLHILPGGVLSGTNAGPSIGNPFLALPIPAPIDGSVWHRLTIRLRYDGPFGLTGGPTGGAIARLIWHDASDPSQEQAIQDIVVYPGWQTISVDLSTNPPAAVTDDSQTPRRIGWAGQQIISLRLDPNEDESARNFYVDYVTLARDDEGRGSFDVRFHDDAFVTGETAAFYLDPNRSGFDGLAVGTAPMSAGANTFHLVMPPTLPNATFWPYVVVHGPLGDARRYADAPVHLVH